MRGFKLHHCPSLRGAFFATRQSRLGRFSKVKTWIAASQKTLLAMTVLLLFSPFIATATEPVTLSAINIQPSATSTRITFILSEKTTGTVKYLPAAKQVTVDFTNTIKHFTMKNARLPGANVTSINSEDLPNNGVRFIFKVEDNVRWKIQFVNGTRLQLDIISIKPFIKHSEQQTDSYKKRLFTVVIDAGHGGKDTGAIGPDGSEEKVIVLKIAKRLAKLINQTSNMRAVLTRDGDYFVPLRGRLRLARKDAADLFIAIHADAHYDKNAQGASIYALSTHGATSEAARWLAQKDNYSELGGIELNTLQDRSPMLRSVLIDLAQTATIRDSIFVGRHVLDALDDVTRLHYKKVEQAPFMVLKSPDIPSILIETGFISNPMEEKRLKDEKYQDTLAQAIFRGIK